MGEHAELVVIGAGPGGYGAAFAAADLGLDVVLIDPEDNPGGVCLYRGCIPSKALLHVARVIEDARHASEWGVDFGAPQIDVDRVREWKNGVVRKLTEGVGGLAKKRKIRHIQGRARFEDPYRLEIGSKTLRFDHAIIATGSRPSMLPGFSTDHPAVMTSKEALDLHDIPSTLLIIGGGYIGLEMASVYAALGSRVTLVEALPELLSGVDRDLVEPLRERLATRLDAILTETRVTDARDHEDGLQVSFEGSGEAEVAVFEKVLVAVGRRPNSDDLGLERTRVEVGPDGFIAVDEERRTTERHIFAIGDVVAQPMLAHKATH
ncbi:MAG: dihydrolipoyl dehydrogenase family protein, partial [Bradymonadaceae bacterium]